jgi:hypothetical protein
MALSILDGNQSATTLSTILSSGQHITAHTVVSLGTQAITDIVNATSAGLTNTQLRASAVTISGAVTANVGNPTDIIGGGYSDLLNLFQNEAIQVSQSGTVVVDTINNSVTIGSLPPISGTVTADILGYNYQEGGTAQIPVKWDNNDNNYIPIGPSVDPIPLPISGTVSLGIQQSDDTDPNIKFLPIGFAQSDGGGMLDFWAGVKQTNPLPVYFPSTYPLPAGTNRIGVVTIGGGTVTIGAGTAQIGSVTASISGTVPISISSVTVGNSVTIGSLPAISGTVTANTFALQGTAVTTSNFTSTTASTVLASFNATREVLTIFNEGAGNLHISAGATCTTIAYQVRLSSGDYYEVPNHQTTITHSAVFATAGTARVTEVS